jgi:hypothetical protein
MTHTTLTRMPSYGETWEHYKGGDYIVLGVGIDMDGYPTVCYTSVPAFPEPPETRPIYVQTLNRFLQQDRFGGAGQEFRARFIFKEEWKR